MRSLLVLTLDISKGAAEPAFFQLDSCPRLRGVLPAPLDTPEKQEIYAKWRGELSDVAEAIVSKSLLGHRNSIGSYRWPDEWEPFMSACILFDPPDTELEKFAELGPFLAIGSKSAAMVVPPVKKMHDPYEERQVYSKAWSAAFHAAFETYLEPLGLNLDEVWQEVHQAHPEILRHRRDELHDLPLRTYVEVNEHTTWADLKAAFKMISEDRKTQPKRGRRKRDKLECFQCAVLHDLHGWTYEQIAERYGWLDHTLVAKYIRDGRKLLKDQ